MKPDKCPSCGSNNIGEFDHVLELPYTDEEYGAAGGRWYCVNCAWSSEKREVQRCDIYGQESECLKTCKQCGLRFCANCDAIKEEDLCLECDPEWDPILIVEDIEEG